LPSLQGREWSDEFANLEDAGDSVHIIERTSWKKVAIKTIMQACKTEACSKKCVGSHN
jgi:hypothetical protein